MTGQAVEGLEDALALRFGHARTAVADAQLEPLADAAQLQLRRPDAAVAAGILEQVAQRAAQQALVAEQRGRHRRGAVGLVRQLEHRIDAGRFLGRERDHVDRIAHPLVDAVARARVAGIEPAGEQHLLHQRVELADVAFDLVLQRTAAVGGRGVEHGQGHLQPRQRRAQLVAGVGQQRLVGLHQRLDARGRRIEARRQRGDLVAAGGVHAVVQFPGAEGLDAALQGLEPARQAPHHRIGPTGHGHEQHAQSQQQADAAHEERRLGHQQAPVGAAPARTQHARPHHPERAAVAEHHALRRTALDEVGQPVVGARSARLARPLRRGGVGAVRGRAAQFIGRPGRIGSASTVDPAGEGLRGGDALALFVIQRQRHAQP